MRGSETSERHFGWGTIARLGLVQAALGAVVVLTTSTFNRVMVVELAAAAILPGALVTLHHAMQILRPRMGHGADVGRRHTPWIVGGMLALAAGGIGAAVAIALMPEQHALGLGLAVVSYALIGGGVSACGTSLLTLLAKGVAPGRRGAAATLVWMMMIAGFAITAGIAGAKLEPYSPARLVAVASSVSLIAIVVTLLAMRGLEARLGQATAAATERVGFSVSLPDRAAFRRALVEVWSERESRRFTAFVLISMLAYSAQDLILEPFAGVVFSWTPGASTQLAGAQHGGAFLGMLLVAVATGAFAGRRIASLKGWVVGGCFASAVMMSGLVCAALARDPTWPLAANVFLLGVANGAFSIAAIASMMTLATQGAAGREGTRMGIWGAAQALAFGVGGFLGTVLVDAVQWFGAASPAYAYAFVFALETAGFLVAQRLALVADLPEHPRSARERAPKIVAQPTLAEPASP